MPQQYLCEKCNRKMNDTQFYTYKSGNKTEMCKNCMTMHVDNFNPDTFLWLLEKMDVPYIESEWNAIRDKAYAKDPNKMNGTTVFGKYLSKMKLKQFNKYTWADTNKLREEEEKRMAVRAEEQAAYEELMKQKLEAGEITEAQYKTMVSTETQKNNPTFRAPARFSGV